MTFTRMLRRGDETRFSHDANVIDRRAHPFLASTMRAAEESSVGLDPVSDDLAAAVVADWRQLVNGALEAVEDVPIARGDHLERQIVVVPAHLALRHGRLRKRGFAHSDAPLDFEAWQSFYGSVRLIPATHPVDCIAASRVRDLH